MNDCYKEHKEIVFTSYKLLDHTLLIRHLYSLTIAVCQPAYNSQYLTKLFFIELITLASVKRLLCFYITGPETACPALGMGLPATGCDCLLAAAVKKCEC